MAKATKSVLDITDPDAPQGEQPAVDVLTTQLPTPTVPEPFDQPKVLARYPYEVRVSLDGKQFTFTVNAVDSGDAINTVYTNNEGLRRKFTKCRAAARRKSDMPVNQPRDAVKYGD